VNFKAMGTAISKAAQHKATRILTQRLKAEGIYVGEIIIVGTVKKTAFDFGNANLEGSQVGDKFWELYSGRKENSITFG
jgi:hypothetical protein